MHPSMGPFAAERAADVRQQRELAVVVEAMVRSTQRDHAIGVRAAAEALRHKMGRVDRRSTAD
jgi:hypothetical protein